eukprot:2483657-Prymnesium_polylepis.1
MGGSHEDEAKPVVPPWSSTNVACSLPPLSQNHRFARCTTSVHGIRHTGPHGALLPLPRLPRRPAGRGGESGVRRH